jgi:site-specific DNA-methyltransferase (adenine-specific)
MSERYELHHGDCLEVLRTLPDNSIDAVVTDPPYGLSFMGKKWDYDVPSEDIWRECLRVLKPGGHLLAFAGTRTQHRMAVRIEDAGFEIRDMIAWVYGSGFPKSHNLSGDWHGWGTALKPALEPITVARKPFPGTVANNVLTWGTGAVNVDGCRVEVTPGNEKGLGGGGIHDGLVGNDISNKIYQRGFKRNSIDHTTGRWPANLIHDGSDEVVGMFPETKAGTAVRSSSGGNTFGGNNPKPPMDDLGYYDSGSAARFFYCAKASKRDRDDGCEGMDKIRTAAMTATADGSMLTVSGNERATARANHHPTVKPTDLMRYLCRLVTPPGGVVLDPFTGSGSTGKGAILEGFRFIGIEREAEYINIARARIQHAVDSLPNTLFDNNGE